MMAGKLPHLLTIQEPVNTQNDYGEIIQTWQKFAQVNGGIEPASGREFWRASQSVADATHGVKIRYFPGVTPAMRILFGSRVLNIISVLNDGEQDAELHILCKEEL